MRAAAAARVDGWLENAGPVDPYSAKQWKALLDAPVPEVRSALTREDAATTQLRQTERSDVIDGAIGEGSPFHETFGYYAHGVGPETAILGPGWEERLVAVANAATRASGTPS